MALEANPNRKFSYVETAFFYRWWQQQDDAMRHKVQGLVDNGRQSDANLTCLLASMT